MKRILGIFLSLLCIILGTGNILNAQVIDGVLYASTASSQVLITIDTSGATGTEVGSTSGYGGITEIEFRKDGILFGSTGNGASSIITINPLTGEPTLVGIHTYGAVNGLDFSAGGQLYGTYIPGGQDSSSLVIVDQNDGSLTFIGTTGLGPIGGLTFAENGTLFGITSGMEEGLLVTIDTLTGKATVKGTTGFSNVGSLEFGPTGTLYAGIGKLDTVNTGGLLTVDTTSGAATLVGKSGFSTLSGLSFSPPPRAGAHAYTGPSAFNFGFVDVGDTSKKGSVVIYSSGTESVTISDISMPGGSFILNNLPDLPALMEPGSIETFDVTFAPLDTGYHETLITITTDDSDSLVRNISLEGNGISVANADSGILYASTGYTDDGRLLRIDPATGQGTLIGATGEEQMPGLAINSAGQIFGSNENGGIFKIDAKNGRSYPVFNTDLNFEAIAFDTNDVLYGVSSSDGILYTIDPYANSVKAIGYAGFYKGLAFNPVTDSLWASVRNYIYKIDKTSGESALVGNTGLGTSPDLDFDIAGNLFASVGGGYNYNQLISVDQISGAGTIIGNMGFRAVSGLAFYNVPLEGKHISVIPGSVYFGVVEPQDQDSVSINISNSGTVDITVNSISTVNAPFSVENLPELPNLINPGNHISFTAYFSPDSAGLFSDSLIISSDAENSIFTVNFSGYGEGILPLIVTSTGDGDDINTGDGICADLNSNCTLRAAIREANYRAGTDTITFNIHGPGPHTIQPNSQLPLIYGPVVIDGTSEPDFSGTPLIKIDGSNAGEANGLWIHSGASIIRGLIINRFENEAGIHIESGGNNVIEGNYIGTDVTGMVAMGNGTGVRIVNHSFYNTIGGLNVASRNIISGNIAEQIEINDGSLFNTVVGNYVGTDLTGTKALGNGGGIYIRSAGNKIGGAEPGAVNLISGNPHQGLFLGNDSPEVAANITQGNYIGTDYTGSQALGNGTGVLVLGANNIIGGLAEGEGNLISGNSEEGIFILGDVDPLYDVIVRGNFIGTKVDGISALANGADGIRIDKFDENIPYDILIGGEDTSAANTIAHNKLRGVFVEEGSNVSILSNSFFENSNAGIRLQTNSAIANDSLDADEGPNRLQNYPEFGGIYINENDDIFTEYKVTSKPGNSTYPIRVQFFKADQNGQGKMLIGEDYYTESDYVAGLKSTGLAALSSDLNEGDDVVATATDAEGNTSAFSSAQTVSVVTGMETRLQLPKSYSLKQNYPNPFNPSTTIRYELPLAGKVEIKIFSALGHEVTTLVNKQQAAGRYSVLWDAGGISSGIYFYKIKAGHFVSAKKCVLLK